MKVNLSIKLNDSLKTITAGDMRRALEGVPDDAPLHISAHKGDRYGTDWHTITISWSEER